MGHAVVPGCRANRKTDKWFAATIGTSMRTFSNITSSEMPSRPNTALELWEFLSSAIPSFRDAATGEEIEYWERDPLASFHSVMMAFTDHFGESQANFSRKQIERLSEFINSSVEFDDKLENAVSTCLLEHLRQIEGYTTLAPFLSARAKMKTKP